MYRIFVVDEEKARGVRYVGQVLCIFTRISRAALPLLSARSPGVVLGMSREERVMARGEICLTLLFISLEMPFLACFGVRDVICTKERGKART